MGGVDRQPKRCAVIPAHRLKIPPQVPLTQGRGLVGGARWAASAQAGLWSGEAKRRRDAEHLDAAALRPA